MSESEPETTPFAELGGREAVHELVRAFYDAMEREEPELTAQHRLAEDGRIHPEVRERFALFLVGWLGGPQEYIAQHGHPRLRMRHARVAVTERTRDAWLRSMQRALDERAVVGPLRAFLDQRFAEVADFMRNQALFGSARAPRFAVFVPMRPAT
jgi:hemoglobin